MSQYKDTSTYLLQTVHDVRKTDVEPPQQSKSSKSSWQAVGLVVSTLSAGLLLAIGHDLFNRSLNGQQVDKFAVPQPWVSRIATAFAFLTQMSFAAAIAASYEQRLWLNLRAGSYKLKHVDKLMAGHGNVFSLLQARAWVKVPGLFIMALTIWIIPLAAVITPGTLTVTYQQHTNVTGLKVPQLSWNGTTWAEHGPISSSLAFYGASSSVKRAGLAAAMTGEVLNVPHTFVNESYHLDFSGPALSCAMANDSVRSTANKNLNGNSGSGGAYTFWSWTGDDDHGLLNSTGKSMLPSDASSGTPWKTLDTSDEDAARIWIMSQSMIPVPAGTSVNRPRNVTECLLHNASYSVDFTLSNGKSVAKVTRLTLNEKLSALSTADGTDLLVKNGPNGTHYAYQSIMDAFGKMLVGYAYDDSEVHYSSYKETNVNWNEAEQTQRDLETLFQNFTLSMFSSSDLLLNSTQASDVDVTVTTYPLIYRYKPLDLFISYGAALLASLIAALAGLQAIWVNGAGYSSAFSTSVRVSRHIGLDGLLHADDDGSGPLPKEVGRARLRLGVVKS